MMNKDSMDTRFRIERVAESLASLDAEKAALVAEMEALVDTLQKRNDIWLQSEPALAV